ncbi:spore germination protein [Halobacillus campisalis]|uniref:Spore germination protein n=1 Tax=Halobacillus campisalis TaxID=435909 RepID=A0ABW2JZ46_9BACI|nr:spore germination protein [Halobacillus campisalis]
MKQNSNNQTTPPASQPLFPNLEDSLAHIRTSMGNTFDLVIRSLMVHKTSAAVIYMDGLVDKISVQNFILEALMLEMPPKRESSHHLYLSINE